MVIKKLNQTHKFIIVGKNQGMRQTMFLFFNLGLIT